MSEEEQIKGEGRFVLKSSMLMIKHQPKWFILTTLSSVFFFLTPLGLALVTREIFNKLEGVPQYDIDIWTLVWIIPIVYVVQVITEITFSVFVWKFTLLNRVLLRKNMIRGVFAQPGADSLEKSPGEAISRFRGDTEEAVWFTALIGDISAFMLFAILAFVIMYSINSMVTLVVFFPFILVVIMINLSRRKLQRYRDESRKAAGKVTGSVGENFGSIQAIKVASAEKDILKHFAKLNDERRRTAVNDTSLAAALRSTGKIVVSISTGVILLLVGRLMQRGEFTLGDFTLFIFLLNWLTGFIRFLGEFLAWFQRNKISYERMLAIMQGKTDVMEKDELLAISPLYINEKYPKIAPLTLQPHDQLNLLEVKGLTYNYPNSENGVKDINLALKKGSFTVIVGRIGSGKTTLLQSLLGLLSAQKGETYWNGELVTDPSSFFIPPKTAYTSQVPVLFSESVEENITMGLPVETIDIEKATKMAVIDEEISKMEEEKGTKIGPKGVRLSGGQKHRLAAARMFLREPELLIFDDLSSALDVKTEEKLWQGLFENKNVTFLVTSHRKYVLNRADQIIVLKNGQISDIGKIGELLERSDEMKKLWEGKITNIEQPEKIEIKTESHFFNIQEIEASRRTYPDDLITQLNLIIPKKWNYSAEIHRLFIDLIDLAFEDDQITSDERHILEQVLTNVHSYSHLLQRALEGSIINEAENQQLEEARKKIYSEAYHVANLDEVITSEELVLLERLLILIKELNYLETK